jgi:hypothetical protein
MDRPGVSDHNMHAIEDGDTGAGQGGDDAQDQSDAQDQDALNEPGGTAPANRGAKDREAGSDDQTEEGEAGPGEEGPGEPVDQPFDPAAFKQEILKEIGDKLPGEPAAPPAPQELSEEEWAQKEEEWGVPRTAIKAFTHQSVQVYNRVMEKLEARFAGIEKDANLRALGQEKGFSDAPALRKGIDEFLANYPAQHHSNPKLLKMAVVYARGLQASKSVQKAGNDRERNRRMGSAARPGAPTPGRRPVSNGNRPLNATQRDVASKFGMSEGEYERLKADSRKPIAI